MDTLIQDLRYSFRSLASRPGFVLAIVFTLALGIGANAAIFSVINGMLLKPLPYDDGERLVQVYNSYPKMGLPYAGTSIPDYLDRKTQAPALADLALYTGYGQSFNLAASGAPERLVGLKATPSLFTTLRAQPTLGRAFTDADAVVGADQVVVLSHATWRDKFGADPGMVDKDVRLNGLPFKVIGVMPEGFAFPNRDVQVWVPFAFRPEQMTDDERGNEFSESIGRLAPGATIEQLNAQMDAIVQRNADRFAAAAGASEADVQFYRQGNFLGRARALRDQWVGDTRTVLWLLQAVVGFVLLIACANVANLVLTRASGRQKELSVRTALGAGRMRIARQLLIESLMLALAGGALGILVAFGGLKLLAVLGLAQNQLSSQVDIDGGVLAFALAISVLIGLAFGVVPALSQLGAKPYESLKEGGRGNTGGRTAAATRNVLVVAQMALAVALLIGAGLMIRSLLGAQAQQTGFVGEGVSTARLDLPRAKYKTPPDAERFLDRALAELRALPGVEHAGFVTNLPFGGNSGTASYGIEGFTPPQGTPGPHGYQRVVDADYFKTLGIPLITGRGFQSGDTREGAKVVVIDEVLQRKYFPKGDAVGKRLAQGGTDEEPVYWTIVGVVGTVKVNGLTDDVTKEAVYFDYRQFPFFAGQGYFALKSALPTGALTQAVRSSILRVDAEQPIYDVRTLDERIASSLQGRRGTTLLLGVFAGVALVLSAIGIYGVLAFTVAQRTGELGVRMAIGAQRSDILSLVLGQGARIATLGLLLGLAGALALSRYVESQLYGVGARDPLTFVVVAVVLAAVALFACWLPARRAAGTNPIVALRYE